MGEKFRGKHARIKHAEKNLVDLQG